MPSKVAGHVMELSNLPQANRLQKHSILVVLVLMSLFNTTSSLLRTTGFCTKGSLTTFVRPLSLYADSNGYSDLGDGFYQWGKCSVKRALHKYKVQALDAADRHATREAQNHGGVPAT